MSRTATVFARVEPEIKENAEQVLGELGIPMSNAVGLFLRQVVLHRGIPFEMKLPREKNISKPVARTVCLGALSEDEFNAEIEKGFADMDAGRVIPSAQVRERMRQQYSI